MKPSSKRKAACAAALTASLALYSPARADDDSYAPVKDATTLKECGSCHLAYPAWLMPASAWKKLMGDLKNHFGDNAELDDATRQHITDYLVANARKDRRAQTDANIPIRISEQPWFLREHGRGRVSPEALKKRGVKSVADCKGCHKGAEAGNFEEED